MKLSTKQLKKFKSVANAITPNKLLPILSYLKFENGEITKNNLESFVTMEADFEGSFLIDEKILYSFIDSTRSDEISVVVKDKSITISDGKSKMVSPTDDVINFPVNLEIDSREYVLNNDFLKSINIAHNFTQEVGHLPYTKCVFVGKGIIAASNGYIAYTQQLEDELPEMILKRNTVSVIGKFDSVVFSENETYQFYSNHVFKFGFIKEETPFQNMTFFSVVPKGIDAVEVNKKEIISFCDTCTNSCPGRLLIANIIGNKLSMVDAPFEINYESELPVKMENFTFNPEFMSKLLKSIPDENVKFVRSKNMYYVTGESGFVCLIMEMKIT